MLSASHRFFLSPPLFGIDKVQELPPPPWTNELAAELKFPYEVLEAALSDVKADSLHFYFTKRAFYLPEYGQHVVPILIQEERCKVPVYSRHVRATIRNLETKPFLGFNLHRRMGRLEALQSFEYTRDWFLHAMSAVAMNRSHRGWPTPVRKEPFTITLPLGYHSQVEIPQKSMAERKLDISFAGNIKHPVPVTSYRYWLSTSKFLTRTQLYQELEYLKETGRWNIYLQESHASQFAGAAEVNQTYSELMMDTRICVSPRGSIAETFRSYEGLRAGCLVVGNRVPKSSFLASAPILVVDHWKELESILDQYARDTDFLEEARSRSLDFWNTHLTPWRLARMVSAQLNRAGETLLNP